VKRAHRQVHRALWPLMALALVAILVAAYATRANRPSADFPPVRLAPPPGA
jgi:hypothetical protein